VFLVSKATTTPEGKIVWQPGTVEALQKYLVLEPHGQFADEARRLLDFNSKFLRDIQSWKVDMVAVDMQSRKLELAQVEAAPTPKLLPLAQPQGEQPEHPKLERALGIAANVAAQLYLTNACPQLRRKALLFVDRR
jgi:hypothetical protein